MAPMLMIRMDGGSGTTGSVVMRVACIAAVTGPRCEAWPTGVTIAATLIRPRSFRIARRAATRMGIEDAWEAFTADRLLKMIDGMQETNLDDDTIGKDVDILKRWAEELTDEGVLARYELRRIKKVKTPKRRGSKARAGRAVSLEEQALVLKALMADPSLAAKRDKAVLFLTWVGLRRSEVEKLTVSDLTPGRGGILPAVLVRGKGGKERSAPLPHVVFNAVQNWLSLAEIESGPIFLAINKGGVIQRHKPASGTSIYNWVTARFVQAGVLKASPHDGRRTFISDSLEFSNFGDAAILQRIAGHASIETTLGYDRRQDDKASKFVERFEKTKQEAWGNGDQKASS